MTADDQKHLSNIAAQTALMELVRLLISEFCFDQNRDVFRSKISKFEAIAVDSLNSRSIWPPGNEAAEQFVKDAGSAWISRIIASVAHPDDLPSNKAP